MYVLIPLFKAENSGIRFLKYIALQMNPPHIMHLYIVAFSAKFLGFIKKRKITLPNLAKLISQESFAFSLLREI